MKSILLKTFSVCLLLFFYGIASAQSIGSDNQLDEQGSIKYLSNESLTSLIQVKDDSKRLFTLDSTYEAGDVLFISTAYFVERMGKDFNAVQTAHPLYIVTDTFSEEMVVAARKM